MTTLLPIGDFSRMTYLTVKALRLYHERGLLAPVQVDPSSGYRYYSPDQLPIAQVIRRLRDLGMPLDMSPLASALISTGPAADQADAMALYGWLVGRWDLDITWYGDDDTRRVAGWMAAEWVLDGRAVQDVWHAEDLFHGTTLRVYDPTLDAWHIQWTEPQLGIRLSQLGRADAAGIVQDGTLPDGSAIRWSFRDIAANSFRWCDERSSDGRTWQLRQEYLARRLS